MIVTFHRILATDRASSCIALSRLVTDSRDNIHPCFSHEQNTVLNFDAIGRLAVESNRFTPKKELSCGRYHR